MTAAITVVLCVAIISYAFARVAEKSISANVVRAEAMKRAADFEILRAEISSLSAGVEKVKDRMARVEAKR